MKESYGLIHLPNHKIHCEFTALTEEYLTVEANPFCTSIEQHPRVTRVLNIRGKDLYSIKFFAKSDQHFSWRYEPYPGRLINDQLYAPPTPQNQSDPGRNLLPPNNREIRIDVPSHWTPTGTLGDAAFNASDLAPSKPEAAMMAIVSCVGHHLTFDTDGDKLPDALMLKMHRLPRKKFVSAIAKGTSQGEHYDISMHFHETLAVFTLMPDALKDFDPETHAFMEEFQQDLERHFNK